MNNAFLYEKNIWNENISNLICFVVYYSKIVILYLQIINRVQSVANTSENIVMALSPSFVWYSVIIEILCKTKRLQWFGKMLKIPQLSMPHNGQSIENKKFQPELNWVNRRKMIQSQRSTLAARDKPISIESILGNHLVWM